jgi:hypothetical protein
MSQHLALQLTSITRPEHTLPVSPVVVIRGSG